MAAKKRSAAAKAKNDARFAEWVRKERAQERAARLNRIRVTVALPAGVKLEDMLWAPNVDEYPLLNQ